MSEFVKVQEIEVAQEDIDVPDVFKLNVVIDTVIRQMIDVDTDAFELHLISKSSKNSEIYNTRMSVNLTDDKHYRGKLNVVGLRFENKEQTDNCYRTQVFNYIPSYKHGEQNVSVIYGKSLDKYYLEKSNEKPNS